MKRRIIVTAMLLLIALVVPLSLFSQDFEMSGTVLVRYNGSAASVTIPEGVTATGRRAFYDCGSLISITIPSSVASIGDYAFDECHSLRTVVLSRRTSMSRNAFPRNARITYSD